MTAQTIATLFFAVIFVLFERLGRVALVAQIGPVRQEKVRELGPVRVMTHVALTESDRTVNDGAIELA